MHTAYVTQFLPNPTRSHQSRTRVVTTLPKPYAKAQKTGRSSLSSGGNLASQSIGREKGEGVLTSFATGGASTAGLVERLSLEDQAAEDQAEEVDEAQRKSTTSTRPRTASATRCFGGRAFAAGLAMGGRLG